MPAQFQPSEEFSVAVEGGEALSPPISYVGQGALGLGHGFSLQTEEAKPQRNP